MISFDIACILAPVAIGLVLVLPFVVIEMAKRFSEDRFSDK